MGEYTMITGINPNHLPFYTFGNKNKTETVIPPEFADTVSLSDADSINRIDISNESSYRELERLRAENEAKERCVDELGKALRIASRIIAGDIVPSRDDKFLLENYPEIHLKAWLLRQQKEEPIEWKSEFKDDDDVPGLVIDFGGEGGTSAVSVPEMPDISTDI